MKTKYYIARDLWGDLYLYEGRPERGTMAWIAPGRFMQLDTLSYPEVMWESEPIEITLSIK